MRRSATLDIGKYRAWGLAAVFCGACVAGSGTIATAGSVSAKQTTRTPFSELKWKKLPNGRQVSRVYGDMKKGAHITLIKFAPGMKTAPHTHSNDYVGIVVKGTARHYEPGKPETETVLPHGSHWAVSADTVHISECLPDSECIFAIRQNAAFDIKPAK